MNLLPCRVCKNGVIQSWKFPYKGEHRYFFRCDPCNITVESTDVEAWNRLMTPDPPAEVDIEIDRIYRQGRLKGFGEGYAVGSYPERPTDDEIADNVENFRKRVLEK